jgi:5-hydroxyisourate hydrolase-like protein (transthyretin family)
MGGVRRGWTVVLGAALTVIAVLAWCWGGESEQVASAPTPRPAARDDVVPVELADRIQIALEIAPTEDVRRASQVSEADAATQSTAVDGYDFAGRVVDDVGLAIERFDLVLEGPGGAATSSWPESSDSNIPLEPGRFALSGLSAGEWTLSARVAGTHRRSAPVVAVLPGAVNLLLVVPRAASLAGFVVDGDGVPIAEAEVHVRDLRPSSDLRLSTAGMYVLGYGGTPEPMAITDRAGAFRIEDVPPGNHDVMALHGSYCEGAWVPVVAVPGKTAMVELRLDRGGKVVGRVEPSLGRRDGRTIGLYSFQGKYGWRRATTEADGSFSLEHVVPQDYVIDLHPLQGAEGGDAAAQRIRRRITVREGESLEVVFDRGARPVEVHGLALLAGVPAPDVEVRAHRREGDDLGERAATGADGRFVVSLASAGPYEFILSSGWGYAYFECEVPNSATHEVTFELPGARVTGRVTDAEGQPLPHLRLSLRGGGGLAAAELDLREHLRRARTKADGTFEIALLSSGTYTLRAPDGGQLDTPSELPPHGRVLQDFVLGEREARHLELRLPPEGRIAGVVVDAQGVPRAKARIGALDGRGRELSAIGWEAISDSSGAFELRSLASGTYVLWVRWSDSRSTHPPLEVEAGRTTTARLVVP